MRQALLWLLIANVAGCYQQVPAKVAGGGLVVADASWKIEPGDRARFANERGQWSPPVPAQHVVRKSGWMCVAIDVALSEFITDVRITDVDDASLPGLIAGVDKPSARTIEDGAAEIYFEGGEVDRWLASTSHHEADPDLRHYEVGFHGEYVPITYSWSELVQLRRQPTFVGWPIDEIRNAKLERGDPRTVLLLALPLLPVAIAGVAVIAATGMASGKPVSIDLEHVHGTRSYGPRRSGWQPRLCGGVYRRSR